ncbi:MAG: hypothetical protein SGJ27_20285 [Candidatus Melainabacteria bacterium]|nr:hypothetical protein [Candidatus Melainabacteria bacterium]
MKLPLITLSLFLAFALFLPESYPAQAQASKPSDAYKQFLVKLYWAKSLKDFSPCMQESTRTHMDSLTGQEAIDCFKKYKRGYVAKFRVIREEVVEERGFIEGDGIGADLGQRVKAHVRAQMVREGGTWKVMQTNWSGTVSRR